MQCNNNIIKKSKNKLKQYKIIRDIRFLFRFLSNDLPIRIVHYYMCVKGYRLNESIKLRPLKGTVANSCISQAIITESSPVFLAKWGITEAKMSYLSCVTKKPITEELKTAALNGAGVFPNTDRMMKRFNNTYFNASKQVDILYTYFSPVLQCEEELLRALNFKGTLITDYLDLFFSQTPWTKALKGKRVLVIHPFAKTIESQYKKRTKLFRDPDFLPAFTLLTYKCVVSMGGIGDADKFKDWEDALHKMESDIKLLEFDIALIGAGAYGIPLGAYIKTELKKSVLHLGGWSQLLFGIKGNRWEIEHRLDKSLYNKYWVRPSQDEIPENAEQIENACYW